MWALIIIGVDAWKQIENIEYGFVDIDNPALAQSMALSKELPVDKKMAVDMIH